MIIIVQSFLEHISKMTSSLTITFSGTSAVLQSYFLPEIVLDEDCEYSCALLDLIIKTKTHDDLNKIMKLHHIVRINCDVISGSYIKGERKHTIHQFATGASHVKDQILVEIPKNLNYFPIKTKNLGSIQISIVNQEGNLVDNIHSADIICRIHIKKDISARKSA